jgi:hypothetical protein
LSVQQSNSTATPISDANTPAAANPSGSPDGEGSLKISIESTQQQIQALQQIAQTQTGAIDDEIVVTARQEPDHFSMPWEEPYRPYLGEANYFPKNGDHSSTGAVVPSVNQQVNKFPWGTVGEYADKTGLVASVPGDSTFTFGKVAKGPIGNSLLDTYHLKGGDFDDYFHLSQYADDGKWSFGFGFKDVSTANYPELNLSHSFNGIKTLSTVADWAGKLGVIAEVGQSVQAYNDPNMSESEQLATYGHAGTDLAFEAAPSVFKWLGVRTATAWAGPAGWIWTGADLAVNQFNYTPISGAQAGQSVNGWSAVKAFSNDTHATLPKGQSYYGYAKMGYMPEPASVSGKK